MAQSQPPARRMRTWAVFLIIVIVLIVIWFLINRRGEATVDAEPTPVFTANVLPTAPQPVTANSDNIVFQDNFDQTVGAWELSPIDQAEYINGVMFLDDSNIDGAGWARPHLRFQDFILDVDSRWLGGSVGGTYGVRFRLNNTGEFLGFYLHNDGWFTIVKNGTETNATLYEAFSPAINRAGEPNHIHIEANGESFRFFVNDGYLADVQIEAPSAGDIMFVAQKVEGTDSFRVGFDNLVIGLHPASGQAQ